MIAIGERKEEVVELTEKAVKRIMEDHFSGDCEEVKHLNEIKQSELAIRIINTDWNWPEEAFNCYHHKILVFYLPEEDMLAREVLIESPIPYVCTESKYRFQLDLSRLYTTEECNINEEDLFTEDFGDEKVKGIINGAMKDIRDRIQKILDEHSGLEDWKVLAAMLIETYQEQLANL